MLDPNNDNLENKNNNNSLEKEDEEKCCPECLIIWNIITNILCYIINYEIQSYYYFY